MTRDVEHLHERIAPGAPACRGNLVTTIGGADDRSVEGAITGKVALANVSAIFFRIGGDRFGYGAAVKALGARARNFAQRGGQPGLAEEVSGAVWLAAVAEEIRGCAGVLEKLQRRGGPGA